MTRRAIRRRQRGGTRRRRSLPSRPGRSGRSRRSDPDRAANLLAFICGAGLVTALACLHVMGRPGLMLRSLWVYDHRLEVRIGLTGFAIAVVATIVGVHLRRGRVPLLILWLGAIAAAGSVFPDRLAVIVKVLVNHYL